MTPAGGRTASGALTVTLTLLGWSSVPLFLRYFAEHIDAWTSNGWRYAVSALLWAPLLVVAHLRGRVPEGLWRAALVPSAVNAIGQVTFCYAHYRIDPGLLTFGLRSHMLFAAVGAYILFAPERPVIRSPLYLLGLAALMVGTAGAVLLGTEPVTGAQAEGVVLSVLSGALFAAYAICVRWYMSSYGSVVAFAAISQYTAVAMVLLMLLIGRDAGLEALRMSGRDFFLLLLSGVIGIALGHVLYYMSIARLGVAVSSGVLQLHPFVVGVISVFLFGEILTAAQWTAGFIAVGGAIMMLGVQARVTRRAEVETLRALAGAPAARKSPCVIRCAQESRK